MVCVYILVTVKVDSELQIFEKLFMTIVFTIRVFEIAEYFFKFHFVRYVWLGVWTVTLSLLSRRTTKNKMSRYKLCSTRWLHFNWRLQKQHSTAVRQLSASCGTQYESFPSQYKASLTKEEMVNKTRLVHSKWFF